MILKIVLAPFALLALLLLGMITHIAVTSAFHRSTWVATTGTVMSVQTLCEMTYQPEGAILREVVARGPCEEIRKRPLPTSGRKPKVEEHEFGTVSYAVNGTERRWEGKLSQASLYGRKAGDKVALVYDPAAPETIDSGEPWKGWFGGLLIAGGSLALLIFYARLFRRPRKGPPAQPMVRVDSRRPQQGNGRQAFGRAKAR